MNNNFKQYGRSFQSIDGYMGGYRSENRRYMINGS